MARPLEAQANLKKMSNKTVQIRRERKSQTRQRRLSDGVTSTNIITAGIPVHISLVEEYSEDEDWSAEYVWATDSVDINTEIFEYLPYLQLDDSSKKFKTGDDDHLRVVYGTGSLRTTGRMNKRKGELESAANSDGQSKLVGWFRSTATSQSSSQIQAQSSDGPRSLMVYGYEISELSNAIEELERNLVDGNSKMDSPDIAVRLFKNKGRFFKARMIRLRADLFVRGEALPISRRGHHPKRKSLIYEDVKFACLEYLRSTDPLKLTSEVFMIHINTIILPNITNNPDLEVSKQTTYRWLALLGYKEYDKKKGIFSDGHDRDDVDLTRHEFILRMVEYTPLMTKWIEGGTAALIA
ncbi:hypothetical protein K3495_g1039 [Podosphaera aphanis]|nr:hypothetical protein K3495_g1039 [Podosphaera aphanis]